MSPIEQAVIDLDVLRYKAEQVEDLVTPPGSAEETAMGRQDATRSERRQDWYDRVIDAILDLSNSMPEGIEDYDVRKLFELAVPIRRLLDSDPEALDADGEIELATMKTADVARRLHRRLVREQIDDPQVAVRLVLDGLARIPVSDIARLLDVSTKTVRSWQQGNVVRQNVDRVVLVAQLMTHLRSSMSAVGVMMWFDAERDQLDGLTPLGLMELDLPRSHAMLIDLARGSRAQLAG